MYLGTLTLNSEPDFVGPFWEDETLQNHLMYGMTSERWVGRYRLADSPDTVDGSEIRH